MVCKHWGMYGFWAHGGFWLLHVLHITHAPPEMKNDGWHDRTWRRFGLYTMIKSKGFIVNVMLLRYAYQSAFARSRLCVVAASVTRCHFFFFCITYSYIWYVYLNPFWEPQSRFGGKLLEFRVKLPPNGSAVLRWRRKVNYYMYPYFAASNPPHPLGYGNSCGADFPEKQESGADTTEIMALERCRRDLSAEVSSLGVFRLRSPRCRENRLGNSPYS